MGRKKMSAEEILKPRSVPFNDADWAKVEEYAELENLSPSTWCRKLILDHIDKIEKHRNLFENR